MKNITGASNQILEINLTDQSFIQFNASEEDIKMYLAGKGLGLKLLYDRMKPNVDPLGKDNYLAFMMGVLMGTGAPCSGRFAALTKSPSPALWSHLPAAALLAWPLKPRGGTAF